MIVRPQRFFGFRLVQKVLWPADTATLVGSITLSVAFCLHGDIHGEVSGKSGRELKASDLVFRSCVICFVDHPPQSR